MNWTGGRLQRHSTAANTIKHRQKQHFARVQQNLRSAPKFKSLAKWSVFDLIAEDRERTQQESSTAQLPPKAPNREETRSISTHPTGLLPPAHAAGKREHDIIEPSPVPDDDLYNATPLPWKYKQERKYSVSLSKVEDFVEPQEESMSEKRRRILRRGDWVGVGVQKPLQVAFASPRDEENIGRRRKVPHGHRARYETRQIHITSPFPLRARCPPHIAPSEWARQQQQAEAGRADVRISIGGRVVPPGLSSSSARTATRHRSQATPSDVMLLDNDDVFQPEQQQAPGNAVQHYSSFSGSQNHSPHRPSGLSQVHSQSQETGEEPGDNQQPENHRKFEGWAGFPSILNNETLEDVQDRENPSTKELGNTDQSSFSNQGAAPTRELYNGLLPQQVFFSSSFSIHHPKPKSSRVSVLIRSESPEEARSTLAEIGRRKGVVPSSQALDNEAWESWIGPLLQEQGSEDRSSFGDTRHHQEVDVSPGISAVPARRLFEIDTSSHREESPKLQSLETEDCSRKTPSGWQQMTSEQLESPSSRQEPQQREEDTERSQPEQHSEKEPPTNFQHDFYTTHRQSPKAIKKSPATVVSKAEDEGEVWRKFVFGSSSDGPEEYGTSKNSPAYGEAGNRAVTSLSMLAHPATRQSIDSTWSGQTAGGTTSAPTTASSYTQEFKYPRRVPPSRSSMMPETGRSLTTMDLHNLYPGSFRPNSRAKRIPASVAANVSSPSASTPSESSSNYYAQKKILFTKPRPFVGRKSIEPSLEKESLHIGRNLLNDKSTNGYERSRRLEHNVNRFGTSDDQDELESIKDD